MNLTNIENKNYKKKKNVNYICLNAFKKYQVKFLE